VSQGRTYWTRAIPEFTPKGTVESVMTISEDITQRLHQEKELLELTVRLFNLQDEERRRIARELHDGTAQNLFAISINLARLRQLDPAEQAEKRHLIDECQLLGDQSLQEIRTLSYLLHPPLLDQAGLVSALQWYVQGFSKRSGIYVDVTAQPIGRLPSEIETALFRIVQEGLTNVRRHSGSETASIRLERRSNEIVLEIKDRGHGLSIEKRPDSLDLVPDLGVGIPGMRQRLRQLGGRLEISSNGDGTAVAAIVPLRNGASHGAHSAGR
jgi:signal transduction histidine kinase